MKNYYLCENLHNVRQKIYLRSKIVHESIRVFVGVFMGVFVYVRESPQLIYSLQTITINVYQEMCDISIKRINYCFSCE